MRSAKNDHRKMCVNSEVKNLLAKIVLSVFTPQLKIKCLPNQNIEPLTAAFCAQGTRGISILQQL
jgi:hypothetical protein